ncbi:MAG: gamma-glutamylcyclotransferase family protein [Magnetospiraceae bacterium]
MSASILPIDDLEGAPAPVHHALDYPFAIPNGSYLFTGGKAVALDVADWSVPEDRHAVIATGSNRSPDQLARKAERWGDLGEIPVIAATLADHDVVYSAHFSRYGSIPATLHPVPKVRADVAVMFLDERQLAILDRSEAVGINYARLALTGLDLRLASGQCLPRAEAYVSLRGALAGAADAPIPLAAVPATGRVQDPRDQQQVQSFARDRLAPHSPLAAFIAEGIEDGILRQRRTEALAAGALLFPWNPTP